MAPERLPSVLNEPSRLAALDSYNILDTPREQDFDDIAQLASEICGTPIAVVNLVAEARQFFKAEVGIGAREVPLENGFCRFALLEAEYLEVPNAAEDPRFDCNPLVTGVPGIRFYAGALLKSPDGQPIGTVCVLDTKPRALTDQQRHALQRLARQTMAQLELRRMVREQHAQQLLHRQILDSATDYAIIAMDLDRKVTHWNEGARRIFGWTEVEMNGQAADRIFTATDRAHSVPEGETTRAVEHGSSADERWHLREDGSQFWASGKLQLLSNQSGGHVGFLKILRDRTKERQQNEELRRSEERLSLALGASGMVGTWDWDLQKEVIYADANFARIYTVDPMQAAAGAPLAAYTKNFHRDDIPAFQAELDRLLQGEQDQFSSEYRILQPEGDYRWVHARGRLIHDADGTPVRFAGATVDITEHRQAEQRARESEKRFRQLTELAPAIIWFGNQDGTLSYLNDHWYAYTGQTPQEALPLGWADVIHPEDLARLQEAWLSAREPGQLYNTEARLRAKDGSYRWFLIRATPMRDEAGAITGWLGADIDIQDRRYAEEELRKAQEHLRLAVDATRIGIFDYDPRTGALNWDNRVRAAFGLSPDVPVTYDTFLAGLHPVDRGPADIAVREAIDPTGPGIFDIEYRTIGLEDQVERWVAARGQAVVENGETVRFVGSVLDITETKRAAEHQRILTGELQHRVKNTLALVQAMASQTLRNVTDVDAAREAFASRLISLSRAHDILTQASWTAAPIMEVVDGALQVHRSLGASRIRISGPNVLLAAKPALSVAMAMHELATNAAKYGALSNESGYVDVRWHVVHDNGAPRFHLTWAEHGGPPVSPPTRRGFGSRLIERSFAAEFGGTVRLTYEPEGVVCRLEASLDSLREQRDEAAA